MIIKTKSLALPDYKTTRLLMLLLFMFQVQSACDIKTVAVPIAAGIRLICSDFTLQPQVNGGISEHAQILVTASGQWGYEFTAIFKY